ncbi:discoidin domain-containing protein [Acetobacter sp. P5B1]|uniref:discoidin domain-containing protein n=1 Tax=Acetobacter sp. P5B1 TaxID=2762620 RepID=UPI001C04E84D|nr:discoidin domain-containing protein [Acetobacter sp. P5B1]
MPKVIDCFSFFNEYDLLEMRLEELDPIVDYFVICEARYTYTGKEKELNFLKNEKKYAKYAKKIIHIAIEKFPEGLTAAEIDAYQREEMMKEIRKFEPDDLIMHSDVDEIPRVDSVKKAIDFDGITFFVMDMYQYYFNMRERTNWDSAYAVKAKYFSMLLEDGNQKNIRDLQVKDFQGLILKNIPPYLLTFLRYDFRRKLNEYKIPVQAEKNAGWHFTNIGDLDFLEKKFQSYAHAGDPWPSLMQDKRRMKQQIDIGVRIFQFENLAEYVEVDETFPAYIYRNRKALSQKGMLRNMYEAYKNLQKMYVKMRRDFCLNDIRSKEVKEDFCYLTPLNFLNLALCDTNSRPVDIHKLPISQPKGILLSAHKKATQSSICEWSCFPNVVSDATNALIGNPTGHFSCHTDLEENPWWAVDLAEVKSIFEIRVFNRVFPLSESNSIKKRLQTIQISVSDNGKVYRTIYLHDADEMIGGVDGTPLIVLPKRDIQARFVKISLNERQCLHLDKVFVYGV